MSEPYGYLWFDKNMERRFNHTVPKEGVIGAVVPVYLYPSSDVATEKGRQENADMWRLHAKSFDAFLSELYAIMVDPCAEGAIRRDEMMDALKAAALRDRESSDKRQGDPKNAKLAALVLKLDKYISLPVMFAPEWEAIVETAKAEHSASSPKFLVRSGGECPQDWLCNDIPEVQVALCEALHGVPKDMDADDIHEIGQYLAQVQTMTPGQRELKYTFEDGWLTIIRLDRASYVGGDS